jgi:hypothetical protein
MPQSDGGGAVTLGRRFLQAIHRLIARVAAMALANLHAGEPPADPQMTHGDESTVTRRRDRTTNDARLTGIIMLPPNGLASDCSRPGAIFMSVGGTLSGAALTQLYGSPRPPMDAGIPLYGCATFTTGHEEFVQVFVTAHY